MALQVANPPMGAMDLDGGMRTGGRSAGKAPQYGMESRAARTMRVLRPARKPCRRPPCRCRAPSHPLGRRQGREGAERGLAVVLRGLPRVAYGSDAREKDVIDLRKVLPSGVLIKNSIQVNGFADGGASHPIHKDV